MRKPIFAPRPSVQNDAECCNDLTGQVVPEPAFSAPRPPLPEVPAQVDEGELVLDRAGWPVGRVRGYEFDIRRRIVLAVISLEAAGDPSIVVPVEQLSSTENGEFVLHLEGVLLRAG